MRIGQLTVPATALQLNAMTGVHDIDDDKCVTSTL